MNKKLKLFLTFALVVGIPAGSYFAYTSAKVAEKKANKNFRADGAGHHAGNINNEPVEVADLPELAQEITPDANDPDADLYLLGIEIPDTLPKTEKNADIGYHL